MFDYTQGALHKVLDDFKKLALGVNIALQLFSILYLVYALCVGVGFLILNALSLLLAIGYLIFFLVMEFTNGANTTKKLIREIYRWSKRGIRLFIILLTAYALIFVSKNFSPLSLVLLLLSELYRQRTHCMGA
jgi:hypothetical protein